ncbi:hypothetical protein JW948_00435 [bacterium]|nr:hypothetical protein [bacterium]
MPLLFWIDFSCLLISTIISVSLVLIVLGTSPGRAENQTFALFAFFNIVWTVAAILLRLSLLSGIRSWDIKLLSYPVFWFGINALSIVLICISSLLFTITLLKKRSRWMGVYITFGVLAAMLGHYFGTRVYLFTHIRLNSLGLVSDDVQPFGWVAVTFFLSYLLVSLMLLWKQRETVKVKYMTAGFLIIFSGILFGGAFNMAFPPMSIFSTLGLVLIGHAMIRLQMLNPLQKLNDELKTLNYEKDILIKEIHHRVKNNMQVIESLLNIESRKTSNEEAIRILTASRNRIHSMAYIHEQLYRTHEFKQIDFYPYVSDLVRYLEQSYNIAARPVQYDIHIDHIFMPIDTAVPCGLILNELITNAFQHAFTDAENRNPAISIAIRESKDGLMTVSVSDNGQGMPADFDPVDSATFGLQCVKLLAEHQLEGRFNIESGPEGTKFQIQFHSERK